MKKQKLKNKKPAKKKRSMYIAHNSLVVHEGLSNSKDIHKKLMSVSKDIVRVANNKNSHLSDVAFCVYAEAKKLHNIADELFARHDEEKKGIMNGKRVAWPALNKIKAI